MAPSYAKYRHYAVLYFLVELFMHTETVDGGRLQITRHGTIYQEAPEGTFVTQRPALKASSRCDPSYAVVSMKTTDFEHFHVHNCTGDIVTLRNIEKPLGSYYNLVISSTSKDASKKMFIEFAIQVVEFNEQPPRFFQDHYSQEVLDTAPPGTFLMKLQASHPTTLEYFVQEEAANFSQGEIPVKINQTTGTMFLYKYLSGLPSTLTFSVKASDTGSPQRSARTQVTLHIRNMSAPRDVKIANVTDESVVVCWRSPIHGQADGYQITYTTIRDSRGPKQIIMSSDEILNSTEKLLPTLGLTQSNKFRRTKQENRTLNPRKNQFCVNITDLEPINLYAISIRGWAEGNRLSMVKEPVTFMTLDKHLYPDCKPDTCMNGICQEQNAFPGYHCKCIKGYTGERCEKVDPCPHFQIHCVHGKCNWTADSHPRCICDEGFTGHLCDKKDLCHSTNPCHNGGTCVSLPNKFQCSCPPDFTGPVCQISLVQPKYCSAEATKDKYTNNHLFWPKTPEGIRIAIQCPKHGIHELTDVEESGSVIRLCQRKGSVVLWSSPDYTNCTDLPTDDDLKVEEELKNLSRSLPDHGTGISQFVDKLADVVRTKIHSKKVARKMAKVIGTLIKNNRQTNQSESNLQTNTKIRDVIHQFASNVVLQPGEQVQFKEDNLVIAAKVLEKHNIPPKVNFRPQRKESSQNDTTDNNEDLYLTIPKSAVEHLSTDKVRFQFVSFDNHQLFQTPNSQPEGALEVPVISATVADSEINHLSHPVVYTLPVRQVKNQTVACVYWDVSENIWSTFGVVTKWSDDGRLQCESDHLTAFSVLIDPHGTLKGHHGKVLSVITYVLLGISTLALVITIATLSMFRALRRDRSSVIVLNLSVALLALNITFICASQVDVQNQWCTFLGALLHYVVLASFTWMLIEARNMHQLLVTVFPSSETHYIGKRLVFGWGCPLLLVLITCLWDSQVYGNPNAQICVMSSMTSPLVYYTMYFVPICCILVVNCVVFALVARILCQRRPGSLKVKSVDKQERKKPSVTLAQFRGAVTVVALLGITWVLGVMAIGPLRLTFQYIFCLTTPLQGVIIFLVRVVQNVEARNAWYRLFKEGHFQSRAAPTSQRTHSSAHSVTQSTGSTGKFVFSSAVRAARRLSSVNASGIFGSKAKTSSAKKPIETQKSSAPMLPDQNADQILEKISTESRSHEQKTGEHDLEEESRMYNTGSDLLLSISKLIPLSMDDEKNRRSISNAENQIDIQKSVQPYPHYDNLTRASSEMAVFSGPRTLGDRKKSLSDNNIDDTRLNLKTLLNPD